MDSQRKRKKERAREETSTTCRSVHQWLRSVIRDSQQPTSPIVFLFLKLPPPPCAALLVNVNHIAHCAANLSSVKVRKPGRSFEGLDSVWIPGGLTSGEEETEGSGDEEMESDLVPHWQTLAWFRQRQAYKAWQINMTNLRPKQAVLLLFPHIFVWGSCF